MEKGFWNYTEPIWFKVVTVRLFPVKRPPLHWQNAFINQERQAVEITRVDHIFYIDNEDGSGRPLFRRPKNERKMHYRRQGRDAGLFPYYRQPTRIPGNSTAAPITKSNFSAMKFWDYFFLVIAIAAALAGLCALFFLMSILGQMIG